MMGSACCRSRLLRREAMFGNCRVCGKPATGYYDITITGIGDFLMYCEEHEAETIEAGKEVDRKRRADASDRQEWNDNHLCVIADEL
jgi:hypothetical protein